MFDRNAFEEVSALAAAGAATLDAAGLAEAVRIVSRVRCSLDAFEIEIANRAEVLHQAGQSEAADSLLARHGRTTAQQGRKLARRARATAKTPNVRAALSKGAISGSHADALANASARLTDEQRDELFARDTDLATAASAMSPERFADHLRGIISALEPDEGADRATNQRHETKLTKYVDPRTGMHHITAVLDPVLGATVFTAIDNQTRAMIYSKNDADRGDVVPALATDWDHVAAHALGALVRGGKATTSGTHAEVVIVIDADTITNGPHDHTHCATTDNHDIPVASARRLLCNAIQHVAITDVNGQVLELGTSTATPNRAQRRALQAMYATCAWSGCDTAFSRCEIHHVRFRRHLGPTDLSNLLPLCVKHHHMVHEGRWRLELTADRTVRIWRPDGHQLPDAPLAPIVPTRAQRQRQRPCSDSTHAA